MVSQFWIGNGLGFCNHSPKQTFREDGAKPQVQMLCSNLHRCAFLAVPLIQVKSVEAGLGDGIEEESS